MSSEFFRVKKGLNISPSDSSTVTSPEVGDIIVDSSDNNKLKRYDDVTSSWKDVGSGAGGINYISNNSDFEGGTVGYATYADAAGEAPVDGTGGTATFVSIGTDSVSPLRGTKSGLISKTANNAQGQGVSYDFIIDPADQAQVLRISFDYSTSANYADGDIRVYIYDYFNLRLIEVVDRDLLASSKGKFVGTFQTSPDSLSYRLIFHVASANALAYTVEIDNVIVGPQTIVKGAIVTDPEVTTVTSLFGAATTPPTFGTLIADKLSYSRRGKYLVIQGTIGQSTAGTAGSGIYHVLLPNNLSPDFDFIENAGNTGFGVVGTAQLNNGTFYSGSVAIRTTSPGQLRFMFGNDLLSTNLLASSFLPPTTAAWRLSFTAEIPILGWSSNVILSEDAGNREIYVRGFSNPTTATFDGTSALIWASISEDSTNSYNTANGTYTVPESGLYDFGATVVISGTEALNTSYQLSIYKNASLAESTRRRAQNTSLTSVTIDLNGSLRFSKGDLIQFRINTDVGTPTIGSDSAVQKFFIAKRSSPQTIAASEVVACRYTSDDAGQAVVSGTDIKFYDIVYDTHNAYNPTTGIFTAPQSGYYRFEAAIFTAAISATVGNVFVITIIGDAGQVAGKYDYCENIFARGYSSTISCVVYLSKGQTQSFQFAETIPAVNLSTSPTQNWMSITKVSGVS